MLDAVLSIPKGVLLLAGPRAAPALLGLQAQLFALAESRGLGCLSFRLKEGEWLLGAPSPAGWPRPVGLRAGCAAEGLCHLPAAERGPGCHLSPAGGSAPGSCREPGVLYGLGTAWACPRQRCCCGVRGSWGAEVGFVLKETMQTRCWVLLELSVPRFKAGISQCLVLPPIVITQYGDDARTHKRTGTLRD